MKKISLLLLVIFNFTYAGTQPKPEKKDAFQSFQSSINQHLDRLEYSGKELVQEIQEIKQLEQTVEIEQKEQKLLEIQELRIKQTEQTEQKLHQQIREIQELREKRGGDTELQLYQRLDQQEKLEAEIRSEVARTREQVKRSDLVMEIAKNIYDIMDTVANIRLGIRKILKSKSETEK